MERDLLLFVVDDDSFITSLVERHLLAEGYRVKSFSMGEECLEAIGERPDVVILDYYFDTGSDSAMNGMEVLERIKEKDTSITVVMLSGQERGEVVLELARKGIEDYVVKDNNLLDNLTRAINEIAERR